MSKVKVIPLGNDLAADFVRFQWPLYAIQPINKMTMPAKRKKKKNNKINGVCGNGPCVKLRLHPLHLTTVQENET